MREIKFRAWDKSRSKMIGSDYPNNYNGNNDEWYGDVHMMMLTSIEDIKDEEDLELMQSTALKDKNGVEIYEGDIVKDSWRDFVGLVEYGAPMFFIIANRMKEFINESSDLEVIGNIYENKELLHP